MSLTTEELMRPRWEVISDYPGNRVDKVGKIVSYADDSCDCNNYPAIYRKLEWWQGREAEDMPKYARCTTDGYDNEVVKVMSIICPLNGEDPAFFQSDVDTYPQEWDWYEPATKEEYEAYKATQEGEKA